MLHATCYLILATDYSLLDTGYRLLTTCIGTFFVYFVCIKGDTSHYGTLLLHHVKYKSSYLSSHKVLPHGLEQVTWSTKEPGFGKPLETVPTIQVWILDIQMVTLLKTAWQCLPTIPIGMSRHVHSLLTTTSVKNQQSCHQQHHQPMKVWFHSQFVILLFFICYWKLDSG
jgi:hypothetical protein